MGFQLVVVQGRSASQTLKVGTGVMTVGRQQDCQLRIASSQVSRKHCQLFEKKGLLLVKDLGSANGTLVNGKKIADQRVLEPGDELTVGSVKFRVEQMEDTVLIPGQTTNGANGPKPADTAIEQPITDEEDVIELKEDDDIEETTKTMQSVKTTPSKKAKPELAPKEEEPIEIGEDAVADYLLNIELDEEDQL